MKTNPIKQLNIGPARVNPNTISGIFEFNGKTVAAEVPIALLTLDSKAWAAGRAEQNRLESLDPEYTGAERSELLGRAAGLEAWLDNDCKGIVPFSVDSFLFVRSAFLPIVVTEETFDSYLEQVLRVSTIVPLESLDQPAFELRNNNGEAEFWLTDNRSFRNARRFSGSDVKIMDVSPSELIAIIAGQAQNDSALSPAGASA